MAGHRSERSNQKQVVRMVQRLDCRAGRESGHPPVGQWSVPSGDPPSAVLQFEEIEPLLLPCHPAIASARQKPQGHGDLGLLWFRGPEYGPQPCLGQAMS